MWTPGDLTVNRMGFGAMHAQCHAGSGAQALERTAPVLPMMPGVPERRSFDYVRHGTIDLFAPLNIATGKVIGKLSAQHRAVDFRCRYCARISGPGH